LGHSLDHQRRGGFRLRWSRADAHSGSGDAGAGGATPAYPFANGGRYSAPYGYRIADACRYAAGNSNPNGDAFSKVDCYTPFAHPDAPADGYNHRHADTPADANAGSHAYAYTNLASDDL
jgi:hypothetical protein